MSTDPVRTSIPGWTEFVDALGRLPRQLLEKLPAELREDVQVQQEVARLVLASLAVSSIEAIGADGDHPCFLPNQNFVLDLPMPNADTTYRVAHITPGGVYRLRGRRGSLRMAHLSQIGGRGANRSAIELGALKPIDTDRFDLILSPARPDAWDGDWWALEPTTNRLLLRMVSAHWASETDPTIAIERVDLPPERPRLDARELERRLRNLPRAAALLPSLFVGHVSDLRAQGYVNRFNLLDLAQGGGLSGQSYYEGAYDLGEHEALVVEMHVPEACVYYSLILGNEIHETTDWYNNHSSLNDAQARPDADGVVRAIVSAKDPGVLNWLDTADNRRGLLQVRWIGGEVGMRPNMRKIEFDEVRSVLPADTSLVTPTEREAIIRTRRMHLQQRPLW